jgi:hypothetical protein
MTALSRKHLTPNTVALPQGEGTQNTALALTLSLWERVGVRAICATISTNLLILRQPLYRQDQSRTAAMIVPWGHKEIASHQKTFRRPSGTQADYYAYSDCQN